MNSTHPEDDDGGQLLAPVGPYYRQSNLIAIQSVG